LHVEIYRISRFSCFIGLTDFWMGCRLGEKYSVNHIKIRVETKIFIFVFCKISRKVFSLFAKKLTKNSKNFRFSESFRFRESFCEIFRVPESYSENFSIRNADLDQGAN
jgi:hypothetical protein